MRRLSSDSSISGCAPDRGAREQHWSRPTPPHGTQLPTKHTSIPTKRRSGDLQRPPQHSTARCAMAAGTDPKRAADAEQLAADWRACEKAAAAFQEEANTGGDGAAAEENALRNVDAKRVAALAELADRPALAGRAAAGAIQRRKRRLADRAAGQMLFALALRDDDDGPDAGAVVPVSRRRAPFCWRKRDVAAAATAAAALKSLAGDASLADAWADAVLARICARSDARHRARGQSQCPKSAAASMA